MKVRHLIPAALAAGLLLAGCSTSEPAPPPAPIVPVTSTAAVPVTTAATPGVYAPTDTGVSARSGVEATILSVETVTSRYGPLTVFTFQLHNAGDKMFEDYDWPTPALTYGEAGLPAEHTISLSEGIGQGLTGSLPPGSRQTLKHGFKVDKAELNPAVLTVGSVVWRGDFAGFSR